jgi:hypothetical protein
MKESDYQKKFVTTVISDNKTIDKNILDNMIPIGKIDNSKVLEVYSTDYKYRMLEAMRSNFESLWMILGDDDFSNLVFEFIKTNPSSHYDLNFYGDEFPSFLQSKAELLEDIPFIIDLANFEITFWKIFHTRNPNSKSIDEFTQMKILNSGFTFENHTVLLKFNHNIYPLFQYKNKTIEDFFQSHEIDDVLKNSYYLLYKKDFLITCKSLTSAQYNFFSQLNEKISLLDVINSMEDITQEEMKEIFHLISTDLLRNLREIEK